MAEYSNGRWPESMFIVLADGWDQDGYWKHLITEGTLYKLNRLIALGEKRTGRALRLSTGYSGYRPYGAQVDYQAIYGRGASAPGYSSHGLNFEGSIVLAMDIGNWEWVYDGDRAAFYADCRAAGLTPGVISPENGYVVDEPWHVIDEDPFATPPAPAQPAPELNTTVLEEDMTTVYKSKKGKEAVVSILANAGMFWQVSEREVDSLPAIWLEDATRANLVADARQSKTRGASPMLLRYTNGAGRPEVVYCAHGGAVRLASPDGDELKNIMRVLGIRPVDTSIARANAIISNIRAGKDA